MKMIFATLVSVALMAWPAAAETQYQSTMSGTVKIEVTPKDSAGGQTQPKPDETLTIHVVQPAKAAQPDEDDVAQKLKQCGEKWNKKLQAYDELSPKLEKYLAYRKTWESYPAQRPPKSPEPLLTRATYRACMYACLENRLARCPGGWPEPKK